MSEALLNILAALLGIGLQFGITFVVLLGFCWVLGLLGMLPETEEQQQAMMIGFIMGQASAKPDDKPPE